MTDVRSAVAAVADRICDARDALDSRRAVQLRAVEPLLEALGWDVRSTEVEPDASVDGLTVDYLLRVDDRPVVAVLTATPAGGGEVVDEESERRLAAVLERGAPDWGLVTDGWHVTLAAREDGELHRRRLTVATLLEDPAALDDYARAAAAERATARSEVRDARRRLAEHREAAIEAIVADLVGVAGEPLREPARDAAERLVDDLAVHEPAADEADDAGDGKDGDAEDVAPVEAAVDAAISSPGEATQADADAPRAGASDPSTSDAAEAGASASAATGSEATASDSSGSDATASDSKGSTDSDEATSNASGSAGGREDRPDDEGEYVVRFFGGGSSVGAIGAGAPGATLAGVVEFLRENHDLAGSVELPWGVQDGRATLAPAPAHPDGTEMRAYRELEGDCYVWTGGGEAWARAAIEELADVAGLRAMFQGDW